jgi:hypothetical protein
MSFFDRLEFLLSQKGLKPYALIDATEILKSTLYSWKKSGVSPSESKPDESVKVGSVWKKNRHYLSIFLYAYV